MKIAPVRFMVGLCLIMLVCPTDSAAQDKCAACNVCQKSNDAGETKAAQCRSGCQEANEKATRQCSVAGNRAAAACVEACNDRLRSCGTLDEETGMHVGCDVSPCKQACYKANVASGKDCESKKKSCAYCDFKRQNCPCAGCAGIAR